MLSSIKITDNTDCQLDYVSKLPAFANGTEYTFKPGVNIIIGPNGCGKSSLMNIVYDFTLCHRTMESCLPDINLNFPFFFNDKTDEVFNGVEVHADYKGKFYRLMSMNEIENNTIINDIASLSLRMCTNHNSTGEKTKNSLYSLLHCMFDGNSERHFPLRELVRLSKKVNDLWSKRLNSLISYYTINHIKIGENYEYTVLMDEPDRNLDINNINDVYSILSFHKPEIQVIAVIHNPALIYKLSKLEGENKVNFVEMIPGYLNRVIEFMEKD